MQITIKNASVEAPAGKKYQVLEVVYAYQGETKVKKLMSFSNPQTFSTLKEAKAGETYEITQVKNDKNFWDWTSATKSDGSAPQTAGKTSSTAPARSSYETTEERALRQRLIVRQSSIAQAIAFDKAENDLETVLKTAEDIAAWVYAEPTLETQE